MRICMKATDVTADAIRCYELDDTIAGQTGIATVSAGSTCASASS